MRLSGKRVAAVVAATVAAGGGVGGFIASQSGGPVPGFDAVTLGNIPQSAQAVGCYNSGAFANCGQARAQFPHAHIVSIATNAGVVAKCLDIEPGDAVPSEAAGWIRWMLSLHEYRPCAYTFAAQMPLLQSDLNAAGLARSSYLLWIASWNGDPSIPQGMDAHQWMSDCCVDKDTFASYFFGALAPPFDTRSFNMGFNAGFASGMGKSYHAGYAKDHGGKPGSATVYNQGFRGGFPAGKAQALQLGRNAESSTRAGVDFKTSFNQGFNTGYATGAARPFYTGFTQTAFGHASDSAAYRSGWKLGRPAGFNAFFTAGYKANKH